METCEYCHQPMTIVTEHHEFWGAPAIDEYAECQNDDCPNEFRDCVNCGERLEFEDGHFLDCKCSYRLFSVRIKGSQLLDVVKSFMKGGKNAEY